MRRYRKHLGSLLAAAVLLGMVGVSGCLVRRPGRVYDPVYREYHPWNRTENSYYRQWERDTHRRHEDFRRRSRREQDDYWRWRHDHRNQQNRQDHRDRSQGRNQQD